MTGVGKHRRGAAGVPEDGIKERQREAASNEWNELYGPPPYL